MAKFTCTNLSQVGLANRSILMRRVPRERVGARPVTEEDERMVTQWLAEMPQAELEDPDEGPGSSVGSLLVFAAKQKGSVNEQDIDALERARRRVMMKQFSQAIRECATGEA